MANEFRPLIAILRDLKALALQKASGFFFVAIEDNHPCTIRLRSGQIEDMAFSRHRRDEAAQSLARVSAGRTGFQADPAAACTARVSLGEASLDCLMGGFENSPAVVAAARGRHRRQSQHAGTLQRAARHHPEHRTQLPRPDRRTALR